MVPVRDPARAALGTEGENQHPTYAKVLSLAREAFARLGPGCKERDYQLYIYNSPWFSQNNIQIRKERYVNINHYAAPRLGRVDLEVDGRFVFELKATAVTEHTVKIDNMQIDMYLQAYAFNKHSIDRAALIYFTPKGVEVVEVDPNWIFSKKISKKVPSSGESELSLEEGLENLSLIPPEPLPTSS